MISADAQIYRHGNGKVILGPAGHALRVRPAGKKDQCQSTIIVPVPGLFSNVCLFYNAGALVPATQVKSLQATSATQLIYVGIDTRDY